MAEASWAQGRDDGWGPATSVRSASAGAPVAPGQATPVGAPHGHASRRTRSSQTSRTARRQDGDWQSGPQRAHAAPRAGRPAVAPGTTRQPGLRAVPALLLLVVIMILGIVVDSMRGEQLSTGFDLGIIIGSVAAILAVRRSSMFWVVVSPPIVYSLGAGISLYARSGGLHDRGVLIDAATNWLVYGFPAIAAASAAVLIIAGIRLIARR